MNKNLFPTLAAGLILCSGMASAYTLTKFKSSPAVRLNTPVLPDSLQKENAFSAEQLLGARTPLTLRDEMADWTTVVPDTSGRVILPKAVGKPELRTYTTRLRATEFAKGKLVLKSTSMGDVFVNGVSVAKKSVADSIPAEASGAVTLNPEAGYEIQLNIVSMPDDKSAPDFRLEFVPDKDFEDVELADGPDIGRRFSTRLTMTGERVSGTSISPDGKYLITRYYETFSATETSYRATLQETATGKMITEDLSSSANWMPKGSTLYYTVKKPAGYDVVTMEVPTLKSRVIARGVPVNRFSITPDGKSLIYYKEVEGTKDQGPLKRVKSPDDRIPGDRDRSYVMRYDLDTHVTTILTYGGATTYICDFSRDGSKMLYIASTMRPAEYPLYFKDLIEMNLNTLATDTIIRNDGFINDAIYSPDAKQLFITGSPQAFGGIGANAGKHEIPNDFDGQGFIYTLADKKVNPVTRDFDPALSGTPVWNTVDGAIYFRGETGFFNKLYRLDPKSGKISALDTGIEYVFGFSMGDDEGTWLSYHGGGFTDTGVAYLLNLKNNKNRLIDDPMQTELRDVVFGKMEPWKFTASDGTEIDGYMCLPPGFDSSKKYPLIVYYYGGTSPSSAAIHHPYSPQVFASRDYVVYVINPSGTTGYGQEFSARHVNAWGKRTAEDIIEGVKKFCDDHSFVDKKKVGCLGASYGGFMTQYLQTLTDIFAAAVSHAGISNVTSYWGEGFWGYSYNAIAAAKSYPWSNPELFTRQGSLFNADKIHTPLLLLHGTEDTNVPIGESIQIFNALRLLGRDVEFITVDGQNHVITDFDKKLIWQDTIMAWFAKYLKGDSRWWNELYGK